MYSASEIETDYFIGVQCGPHVMSKHVGYTYKLAVMT